MIFFFLCSLAYGQNQNSIQQIDRIRIEQVTMQSEVLLPEVIMSMEPIYFDHVLVSSIDYGVMIMTPNGERSASKSTYLYDEIQARPRDSDVVNSIMMTVPAVYGKF
jgi:hypothetical protein